MPGSGGGGGAPGRSGTPGTRDNRQGRGPACPPPWRKTISVMEIGNNLGVVSSGGACDTSLFVC